MAFPSVKPGGELEIRGPKTEGRKKLEFQRPNGRGEAARWGQTRPTTTRASVSFLFLLLITVQAHATAPHLASITPTGGQRGTELEVSFQGERLQDTEEIICYEPVVQIAKLNLITNKI